MLDTVHSNGEKENGFAQVGDQFNVNTVCIAFHAIARYCTPDIITTAVGAAASNLPLAFVSERETEREE